MLQKTREKQIENMIHSGLRNLYKGQDQFSFEKFSIITLESLMLLEREEYLKSVDGSGDSGNGSYLRSFKPLSKNSLRINIPRSRKGVFKPMLIDLVNNRREQVNDLSLLLYRKGLSTRDVSDIMGEFFGESISRDTIINLADSFNEIRKSWENRKLDAYYKVMYCDSLYTSLRRGNSYSKEPVYIIYGVKDDNTRELLLLEVNPTEGSEVWREYFDKLRSRGVEQVDLIVADGLPGFAQKARKYFVDAEVQRCVVHLQRNIMNKIRPRDKEAFGIDLKHAFNNFEKDSSKENALKKLDELVERWRGSYGRIIEKLVDEEFIIDYLTYIDYPVEVRRMIYTMNSIENLNRQVRKVIKTKVTFEQESNLLDLVFMVIKDFESNNWQKYPVHNFQFWPKFTQSI